MEVKQGKGNISIGSVSGDVEAVANEGNIKLHLSQPKNINLKAKQGGNISITTNKETQSTAIHVKAKDININPEMNIAIENKDEGEKFTVLSGVLNNTSTDGSLEGQKNTLNVEAKHGTFKLETQDWLSSLNLKNIS